MKNEYEKKGYLIENFRVFHLHDAHGMNVEYHYHEFCKILILLSGAGSYFVEGKRYALKAGDIVLMHDYIGRGSQTAEALEALLPKLLERGFEFVTVSELALLKGKTMEAGKVYYKF